MLTKEISIIIPAYNCEDSIDRCVRSLLQDKEVIFEILIINDGSTDSTPKKLEELSNSYSIIKVINSSNRGSGSARNIGLKNVTGKYIYFMDADDFIDKKYLINMYNISKDNNVDFVCSSYKEYNNKMTKQEKVYFDSGKYNKQDIEEVFYPSLICDRTLESKVPKTLWNKLFLREFLIENKISFDEELIMSQDVVFTTRSFLCAGSIFYLPTNNGYNYVLNLNSRTHICVPDIFNIMKMNYQIVENITYNNKKYDLSKQLPYLMIRNTMTAIANLGKKNHLSFKKTKEIVKMICSDDLVVKSIELTDLTKFSISRKVLFHLIKNKNARIIVLLTFFKGWIDK